MLRLVLITLIAQANLYSNKLLYQKLFNEIRDPVDGTFGFPIYVLKFRLYEGIRYRIFASTQSV